MRASPDAGGAILATLEGGAHIKPVGVLEASGYEWFQIVLDDGRTGFVRENQVLICTQGCRPEQ